MKRLLILSIILALLMANTLPALANGRDSQPCGTPPSQANQRYALAGWITALDAGLKRVSVRVAVGNVLAEACVGDVVVLDARAAILKVSGGTIITFEDLERGDPVSSNGYLVDEDEWSALQITVGAILANKDY